MFKHSEDANIIFQCCADEKMWGYVPLLDSQVDG